MKRILIFYFSEVIVTFLIVRGLFEQEYLKEHLLGNSTVSISLIIAVLSVYFIIVILLYLWGRNIYEINSVKISISGNDKIKVHHSLIQFFRNFLALSNFMLLVAVIILLNSIDYSGEMNISEIQKIKINYIYVTQNDDLPYYSNNSIHDEISKLIIDFVDEMIDISSRIENDFIQTNESVIEESKSSFELLTESIKNSFFIMRAIIRNDYQDLSSYKKELITEWNKIRDIEIGYWYYPFAFQPAYYMDSGTTNVYSNNNEYTLYPSIFQALNDNDQEVLLHSIEKYEELDAQIFDSYYKLEKTQQEVDQGKESYKHNCEFNYSLIFKNIIDEVEKGDFDQSSIFPILFLLKSPDFLSSKENLEQMNLTKNYLTNNPEIFSKMNFVYFDYYFKNNAYSNFHDIYSRMTSVNESDFEMNYDWENFEYEGKYKDGMFAISYSPTNELYERVSNQFMNILNDKNNIGYMEAYIEAPNKRFKGIFILFLLYFITKLTGYDMIPNFRPDKEGE